MRLIIIVNSKFIQHPKIEVARTSLFTGTLSNKIDRQMSKFRVWQTDSKTKDMMEQFQVN